MRVTGNSSDIQREIENFQANTSSSRKKRSFSRNITVKLKSKAIKNREASVGTCANAAENKPLDERPMSLKGFGTIVVVKYSG